MYLNSHIGTGYSTNLAADAARSVDQFGIEIALHSYLLGHTQNLLGAGLYTQFATLAVILVYGYTGHQ